MTRRRRFILLAAVIVVGMALILWITVHTQTFQRWVWEHVTERVSDATGWRLDGDRLRLNLLPARFEGSGIRLSAEGRTVVAVDRLAATWSWWSLLGSPPKLARLEIDGVTVDLQNLPSPAADGRGPPSFEGDPLQALEIGEFELRGGSTDADAIGIGVEVRGLRVSGSLADGIVGFDMSAPHVAVDWQSRTAELGPVELGARGNAAGLVIDRLEFRGDMLRLAATGNVTARADSLVELEVDADLDALARWWNPNLSSGLQPRGRALLVGEIRRRGDGDLEYRLEHRGRPIEVIGFPIDRLGVIGQNASPAVSVGSREWGDLRVTIGDSGVINVGADLDGAPLGPALALAYQEVPAGLPKSLTASGELDVSFAFPINPETVAGTFDLVVDWDGGSLELRGEGAGMRWRLDRFAAAMPGLEMEGSLAVGDDGSIRGRGTTDVQDPALLCAALSRWWPAVDAYQIGGGPLHGDYRVSGVVAAPNVGLELGWSSPAVEGRQLMSLAAAADGWIDDFGWRLEARATSGSAASADGRGSITGSTVEGVWEVGIGDLSELAVVAPLPASIRFAGRVVGKGSFAVSGEGWRADGSVEGHDLAAASIAAESLRCRFDVDPRVLSIADLEVHTAGGTVTGSGTVPLSGLEEPLALELTAIGLKLERLLPELPRPVMGTVDARAVAGGSAAEPEIEFESTWSGDRRLLDEMRIHGSLADGVIRMISDEIATAAGPVRFRATLPVGDLARPEWIWTDAAGGPLQLEASGSGLRSGPLMTALGRGSSLVEVAGDVELTASWDLVDSARRYGELVLEGLAVNRGAEVVRAQGPLRLSISGDRFDLAPVILDGLHSRIEAVGSYDAGADRIQLTADATVSPGFAQLIPFPLRVFGPVRVSASVTGTMAAPIGSLVVDHAGGLVVMRDPALEIADLRLEAELGRGGLWINDGSAVVNRGAVRIGGGWDVRSGQGIVVEAEGITMYFEGILSRWSGAVAIEPDPQRLALVSGDLVLDAGLWDRPFDVTGTFFGPESIEIAGDDPLRDVLLDLDVRGRGGVRVDNNLGRFQADWDMLEVRGTAAAPVMVGDIRIAPGGTLRLPGRTVTLQRGLVRFTGDNTVDPVLELVPVESIAAFSGGDAGGLGGVNATAIATQGLASGLGSALGFENETLRPVEIAVETETETSTVFSVGRRITRSLAFFYATDFADVQNRTSMLQLWNIPGLSGLALQGFQKTLDSDAGLNAFQRWRWGGSGSDDDRPVIHKIRLEGSWPISTRRLKRATGIRKGEPYDPFLLFVARVRMERELAGEGYHLVRVDATAAGEGSAPTLVFSCDPGPRQTVDFEGGDPPKRIRREVVALYQSAPLESSAFRAMRSTLLRHYRTEGHPLAEVTVERRADRVVAAIERGPKLRYEGPHLTGVPSEGRRAVAEVLGTRAELAAAVADVERVDRIVKRVLFSFGYHDARVERVWTEPLAGDRVEVHIDVEPGPRELIAAVRIAGIDPLGLTAAEGFGIGEGAPLDRSVLDAEAARVRRAYHDAGYDHARVRAVPSLEESGGWQVDVEVEPGVQRTVVSVEFTGLRHVGERALRKGLLVAPGSLARPIDVDTSAVRIANFAPVERVDVVTRPSGSSGTDVEFAITEKPRWIAEVGAGLSSERGFEGRLGVRDENLFGRGVSVNLRGRWNQIERIGLLYTGLPPLPGGRISFASTIAYRSGEAREDPEFLEEERRSASLEMTYMLDQSTAVRPFYRFTRTHTFEKEPDPFFPLDFRLNVATLGAQYLQDRFDNIFDPRSGYGVSSSLEWSGSEIGSDLDSVRLVLNGTMALEPRANWTWVQTARIGGAEPLKGTNLDPEFRFFAGGQGSVRGFLRDAVGPINEFTGSPMGGGALFILNEELRLPVWGSLRVAGFADIGQVWESWGEADLSFSVGAGVGLRWSTPIGLVWGDVAWPVANTGISSGPQFYLGIGRPF